MNTSKRSMLPASRPLPPCHEPSPLYTPFISSFADLLPANWQGGGGGGRAAMWIGEGGAGTGKGKGSQDPAAWGRLGLSHPRQGALRGPHLPGPGCQPRGQPGFCWLHQWQRQDLGPAGLECGQVWPRGEPLPVLAPEQEPSCFKAKAPLLWELLHWKVEDLGSCHGWAICLKPCCGTSCLPSFPHLSPRCDWAT